MKKIHTFLVASYLALGLTLVVSAQSTFLEGTLLPGETLTSSSAIDLHGAAPETDPVLRAASVTQHYERAAAAKTLVLGILFIVLGGFVHAYYTLRSDERPVRVRQGKKKRRETLFWLEMKV